MRIIKVNATDSTNSFLREMYRENPATQNLCLSAYEQTKGRGQKGTLWQCEAGKNLTSSLLLTRLKLGVKQQFKLSAMVSLTVLEVLEKLSIPNLKIKWPNDILADNFKIGGILIENFLKGDKIHASIIGIGLNVNQEKFDNLPKAGSLQMLTGKNYDLERLLETLADSIEKKFSLLNDFSMEDVLKDYHHNLFAIHKVSTFQLPSGKRFSGILRGIDEDGRLEVLTEANGLEKFEVKQIKLLY